VATIKRERKRIIELPRFAEKNEGNVQQIHAEVADALRNLTRYSGQEYNKADHIEAGREDNMVLRSGRDVAALMINKNDLASLRQDVAANTIETQDEPTTFQEAWNHPDPEEQKQWKMAIRKEFNDMNTRKV